MDPTTHLSTEDALLALGFLTARSTLLTPRQQQAALRIETAVKEALSRNPESPAVPAPRSLPTLASGA